MAEISATMVKDLREKTGAGMMDCKKALAESGGDFAKAEDWLRKKGISKAASKGARIAAEGLLGFSVSADGRSGVLAEVNSETDFVARNPDFVALTKEVAELIAKGGPADLNALLATGWKDGKKVQDLLTEAVAKIGENITVRRFAHFVVKGAGVVGGYLHSNGRQGALVELTAGTEAAAKSEDVSALAKELAMQATAMKPPYLRREDVPADVLEKEKEIYRSELAAAKKPEAIWDKILTGKLEKFYEGVCLVDQVCIKDDKKKVKGLLAEVSKKLGTEVTATRFARFEVGEGIEKKKEDLAAEVAKTLGQTPEPAQAGQPRV
jgi:elongation factor Ts